jgi:hypothetical protein
MVEIRAIFGDDDRENEEFLGYDLDNIEEAEERYIRQIDALNDFDRPTLTFLIPPKKKIGKIGKFACIFMFVSDFNNRRLTVAILTLSDKRLIAMDLLKTGFLF